MSLQLVYGPDGMQQIHEVPRSIHIGLNVVEFLGRLRRRVKWRKLHIHYAHQLFRSFSSDHAYYRSEKEYREDVKAWVLHMEGMPKYNVGIRSCLLAVVAERNIPER